MKPSGRSKKPVNPIVAVIIICAALAAIVFLYVVVGARSGSTGDRITRKGRQRMQEISEYMKTHGGQMPSDVPKPGAMTGAKPPWLTGEKPSGPR